VTVTGGSNKRVSLAALIAARPGEQPLAIEDRLVVISDVICAAICHLRRGVAGFDPLDCRRSVALPAVASEARDGRSRPSPGGGEGSAPWYSS
jgi:hypothetical protein